VRARCTRYWICCGVIGDHPPIAKEGRQVLFDSAPDINEGALPIRLLRALEVFDA